jgi:hypothetical protein
MGQVMNGEEEKTNGVWSAWREMGKGRDKKAWKNPGMRKEFKASVVGAASQAK